MEDTALQTCDTNGFSPPSAATLRELQSRAQAALSARRGQISHLEDEITKRLEAITSAIAEQRVHENSEIHEIAQTRAEIERLKRQMEEGRGALAHDRAEQEAALEKRRKELEARSHKQDERAKQLAELGCELEARQGALEEKSNEVARREGELEARSHAVESTRRQFAAERDQFALRESEWKVERETLELARDELLNKLARLESHQHGSRDEWQKQLAEFEHKLQDQQASWSAQRGEWDAARATVERDRDELKQKFELALEDVQRFRARVTELEQELARRPAAGQADSAELTALRAERDALAERVETLERQPPAQTDADAEEQIADLQRRFELAVEDVRELKTKNAELESRLSAAKRSGGGGGTADSGGMDWESQKRRMLASLEDEGDSAADGDEERQKERASIEDTIEMTDAVVAEKDREIEELRKQLVEAESAKPEAADRERQQQIDELVSADEVIAEHRKRISQLENEMENKLRATELELSVERAKLAREKSELEELRIDLESRRKTHGEPGSGTKSVPRRRWLSKLGLSGDDHQK
jgi:chromosome segregation ATPase